MQKSERTFPNLPALPCQTAPGRVTATRCRSAVCPWPENESLTLRLNASFPPPEVTSTVCRHVKVSSTPAKSPYLPSGKGVPNPAQQPLRIVSSCRQRANCNREREEHLFCLPSERAQPSGSSAQLLQPRVLRLGLLQDGDVRVGVLPEIEEILVGGAGLGEGVVL
jgi:hypothetical protein